MIIDLPENFQMEGSRKKIIAFVENGMLKLKRKAPFRKVMTEITFELKGSEQCCYCKQKIPPEEVTIDHMYPQDFGGPTIPDNMAQSCQKCNSEKDNLNICQYMQYLEAKKSGTRKSFMENIKIRQAEIGRQKIFDIPREWYESIELSSVIVLINFEEEYKSSKYKKVAQYYETYQYFQKPIIVDRNGFLLDGFFTVMYAKEHGIKSVPAIMLENVEVML